MLAGGIPMKVANHPYYSFLLRLWRVQEKAGWSWRASLEDVEDRELVGFASLDDLLAFLCQITGGEQEVIAGKTPGQPPE